MNKKAFSLLELITGMVIFAVAMAFGINTLLNLKESVKLKEVTTNLVVEMRTNLNHARNNVYTPSENNAFIEHGDNFECSSLSFYEDFLPDAIGYYFLPNEVHKVKCLETGSSIGGDFCCKDLGILSEKIYINDSNIKNFADCGVIFEYSTGDISTFSNEDGWASDINYIQTVEDDCTLRIFHDKLNIDKTIIFKVNDNSIYIE